MQTVINQRLLCCSILGLALGLAGKAHAGPVPGQGTWQTTLLGRDISGTPVGASSANAGFKDGVALLALAVRPGDVATAVPEPSTSWLLLAALGTLRWFGPARRGYRAQNAGARSALG